MRNELSKAFALELPATLVFDYPTISTLVQHLTAQTAAQQVAAGLQQPPAAAAAAVSLSTVRMQPVASVQAQRSLEQIQGVVAAAVRSIVGSDPGPEVPLASAGMDSLAAVELQSELSRCASFLPYNLPGR